MSKKTALERIGEDLAAAISVAGEEQEWYAHAMDAEPDHGDLLSARREMFEAIKEVIANAGDQIRTIVEESADDAGLRV